MVSHFLFLWSPSWWPQGARHHSNNSLLLESDELSWGLQTALSPGKKKHTFGFHHKNEWWSTKCYKMGREGICFGEKGAKSLLFCDMWQNLFFIEMTDTWMPLPGSKNLWIYQCRWISQKQDRTIPKSPWKREGIGRAIRKESVG